MREDIEKILEAGIQAPSGGNSQPWKFRVRDNQIEIIALPEKDHPILNFRNRGTWVAHGALLENILIASRFSGYAAQFDLFPDKSKPNLTARINLEKTSSSDEPLYKSIFERTTNRKPYKTTSLTAEQKTDLLKSSDEVGSGEIKLIEEPEKLKILGEAVSVNEVVMFENPLLHQLFFKEVVWTRDEEKKKRVGLFIKTLELKPPQETMMKLFRYWPIMKFFNTLGLARMIAKDNARIYSSSALMGAIIVEEQDENFIAAGRVMERLWLKATEMKLGFHLITGVLFLWQRITAGDTRDFSEEHIELVKNSYEKIVSAFEIEKGIAALIFRVGEGGQPSARSSRIPINNLLIK